MHDWKRLKRGFAGLRRKGKRLFGILGNPDGLIDVPERPGYQYARVERGAERVTLVCKGHARPRLNTAVIIEQHPITGEFEIVDLDVFTTQAAGDDPGDSLFELRAHAASHEWREDADDMLLWLHPNQFYFLRVQPAATSGHVVIQGGPYFVGGKIRWKREQNDVDLNPYYPASGSAWVMLCLDAAGAVTVVQAPGAVDAEKLEDLDNVPLGHEAVAAVRLTAGLEIDFFSDIIPLWQVNQLDASVLGNGTILIQDTLLVVDVAGNFPSHWGEWAVLGQFDLCGKTFLALQTRWDSDYGFFGVVDEGPNRKDTVILFGDDGTGVDESLRDRFIVYGYGTYGESETPELRAFLTINQDGSIEPYEGATFDGVDVSAHAVDSSHLDGDERAALDAAESPSASNALVTESALDGALVDALRGTHYLTAPGELVTLFEAQTGETADASFAAYALLALGNTLFLGLGNDPGNSPGALIARLSSGILSAEYQPDEQGVHALRAQNDVLWVPGTDPSDSWDYGNLYRRDDLGAWSKIRSQPNVIHTLGLYHDGSTLWAATGAHTGDYVTWVGKVLRSTDDGATWDADVAVNGYRVYSVLPFSSRLYAAGYDVVGLNNVYELYVSTDDGDSWSTVSGVEPQPKPRLITFAGELLGACLGRQALFSMDAAGTPTTHALPFTLANQWNVLLDGGNGSLYVLAEDGVYRTADLVTWELHYAVIAVALGLWGDYLVVATAGVDASLLAIPLEITVWEDTARLVGGEEGQAAAQALLTAHTAQADAHHPWPLSDAEIPAGIARLSQVVEQLRLWLPGLQWYEDANAGSETIPANQTLHVVGQWDVLQSMTVYGTVEVL